jgi:putative oxidoreductase
MTGIDPMVYLAARVLSCGLWIPAGLYKIMHFEQTVEEIRHLHVPLPRLVLPSVIAIELVGSALMIFDVHVWAVALAWMAFMVPATAIVHGRWVTPQRTIDFVQFVLFWKNVSLAGGLIALIALDASRPAWLFRG